MRTGEETRATGLAIEAVIGEICGGYQLERSRGIDAPKISPSRDSHRAPVLVLNLTLSFELGRGSASLVPSPPCERSISRKAMPFRDDGNALRINA